MAYLGRLFFLLLCIWSAGQAWASLPFEKGQYAFDHNHVHEAHEQFRRSADRGFLWPDTFFDLGYSSYLSGLESKELPLLKAGLLAIEKAEILLPLKAKYLVYKAKIKLQILRLEGEGISTHWPEIENILKKAYDLRGANLWVPFQIAKIFLSYRQYLDEKEIEWAHQQLQLPCKILPDYYLEPALKFLLSQQVSPEWVSAWLPPDYKVAFLADGYFRKTGRWSYWQAVYPQTLKLRNQEKEKYLFRVAQLLQKNQIESAYEYLQQAHWIDNAALDLQVYEGLLQFQMKRLGADEKKKLITNLESFFESGLSLKAFTEFGRIFIHNSENIYLKALFSYSQGDMQTAVKWFDQTDLKSTKAQYFKATAYLGLRQTESAVITLRQSLNDTYSEIDLRNLDLLASLAPEMKEEIELLKEENTVRYRPASAWAWNEGLLRQDRAQGMVVSLEPGNSKLFIAARHVNEKTGPSLIAVRLQGDYIGSFWVKQGDWRSFRIPATTEGGRFWLSMEVMNHRREGDVVQLGELRIR